MTTPSEEEARALIEEIEGRIRHDPGCHECDLFRRTAAALASRVSTPPSEALCGHVNSVTGWVCDAHDPDNPNHHRKLVSADFLDWYAPPVPAVPVLPTEPGTELEVRSDAPTPVTPTEPEEMSGYCRGCGDPASKHDRSFCTSHYSPTQPEEEH